MNNELANAVNTAKKISSALSTLFFKGHHTDVEGLFMVFAGFDAMQAAAELGREARGRIFLIPNFEMCNGEVALKKVLVVDGISSPNQVVYMICDFIRYPDGSYGLLADLKGHTVEFRCINETQLLRRALRRPRNAAKLIDRGRRALAEQVEPSPALAA